jgi:hypothetical protein
MVLSADDGRAWRVHGTPSHGVNLYEQVMMAERNRRGIKAEMEESREILEAYVEENKTLVALLARGRALVQTLQQNSADAAKPDSPLMQAGPHCETGIATQVWLTN